MVPAGAVQLACLHPPYLDMVQYTKRVRTDLSTIYDAHQFCHEMEKIAHEVLRVLRPGGYCGLLIGDVRRKGRFVPLGFLVMSVFTQAGFGLLEVNVKEQHRTSMAEFWKKRDNLYRLEHEYLLIFRKPQAHAVPAVADGAEPDKQAVEPVAGAAECIKGYGRVAFGVDGFCPVAGHSVYTTPCALCRVPSRWPVAEGATLVLKEAGTKGKVTKKKSRTGR